MKRSAGPALPIVLLALALALPGLASAQSDSMSRPPVYRSITIDGPITAVTADYVERAVRQTAAEARPAAPDDGNQEEVASEDGASDDQGSVGGDTEGGGSMNRIGAGSEVDGLLIILDTPGGDVGSMQRIAGSLLNAPMPTIVWVGPEGAQAASAGTFIVLAAHAAGMAPRTTIGAASPVGAGGEDLPETVTRKATEDLAAAARSYADRRGEEAADWAERAVREAVSASAAEALDIGLIDAVAPSPIELMDAIDGESVTVAGESLTLDTADAVLSPLPMNFAESFLDLLVHPAVAVLLLTIGVNAILIELSSPGGFVPGTIGVLALVLGLYSLGALEANLVGLIFVAAAFAMFVLEVNTPTYGVLSAAGIGLFVLGAAVLFADGPWSVPWGPILAIAVTTAVFFTVALRLIYRTHTKQAVTGSEGLIGAHGPVRKPLDPEGTVLVQGELWDATTASGIAVPQGAEVVVENRDGFTLIVRPLEEATAHTARHSDASAD